MNKNRVIGAIAILMVAVLIVETLIAGTVYYLTKSHFVIDILCLIFGVINVGLFNYFVYKNTQ